MPHVLWDAFHETVPLNTRFIFVVLVCDVFIKYITALQDRNLTEKP